MNNAKTTRKALLTSVVALVICVTMLMGTTFAWFTDTATVAVNQIVSGKLDIALYNGVIANGAITYPAEVTETTKLFKENVLWEPGHVEVAYLKLDNIGNLALKYQLTVSVANEVAGKNSDDEDIKLSRHLKYDVVEIAEGEYFTTREAALAKIENEANLATEVISGSMLPATAEAPVAKYLAVIVYMPETVGNEANYRGETAPSIDLGVNLFATQHTYEEDSFDETYDAGAANLFPDAEGLENNTDDTAKTVSIETPSQLLAFAQEVNGGNTYEGYTISLADDMDLAGMDWTPIGNDNNLAGSSVDLNSNKPVDGAVVFSGSFNGNGHTISNFTLNADDNNVGFFGAVYSPVDSTIENVVFDNATVIGTNSQAVGILAGAAYSEKPEFAGGEYITDPIKNIIVKNSYVEGNKYVGGIVGYSMSDIADVTVENTTVVSAFNANYSQGGEQDSGENAGAVVGNLYDVLTIKNATVTKCTVSGFDKVGGIAGSSRHSNAIKDCKVTDLTVKMVTVNGVSRTRYGLITGRVNDANAYANRYTGNTATGTATLDGVAITVTEYALPN